MQEVDFYELSRAVQERFIACLGGQGQPAPILVKGAGQPRGMRIWTLVCFSSVTSVIVLYQLGLGRLDSGLALQGPALIALYGALLSGIFVAILQLLARLHARQSLPFVAGTYLFPSGVIDACTHKLRVFPFAGVMIPSASSAGLSITFPEAAFTFPVASQHLEQAKIAVEEAQARVEAARASVDHKALGLLDPLFDVGVANPFAPKTKMVRAAPSWARLGLFIGIAVGGALSPGIWWLRNRASDDALLNEANRLRSVEGYRAYLDRGGRRPEVREVLLPRVELRDAVKQGTVEGIEAYIASHPNSGIQSEITAAMRQAMLVALDTVKKAGTVTALNEFAKKHPNKLADAEIHQAVHAVYQAALAKYKKESGAKDPAAIAFIERVLAVAEKSGPKVELRFRRKVTRTMEMADNQIKKSPFFMGPSSLPSQYFDDAHAKPREETVAKTIAARFAAVFPADILTMEMGAPVPDGDGPWPPGPLPTLFIEHTSQVSGPSYLSQRPRGVFVGLSLIFEADFRLPDDPKPMHFKLPTWRNPDPKTEKGEGSLENAVYEAMVTSAFAQFTSKYLTTFFAKADLSSSEPKPADSMP